MRLMVVSLLLLSSTANVSAQSKLSKAWYDVKHAGKDVGSVWTSPLHTSKSDLVPLGLALAGAGVAFVLDDDIQDWLRENPSSTAVELFDPFREGYCNRNDPEKTCKGLEELGDIWEFIRVSSVMWVTGVAVNSKTLREAGVGCAAAGMAQTFPRRLALYELVARTRPSLRIRRVGAADERIPTNDPYDFDVPGTKDWNHRSFFGGHAANAMTCITFWNHRFNLGLAEPVLYAAALAVGVSRTLDEAHWSSDTVIGIVWGYAIGKAVADRQKARLRTAGEEDSDSGLQVGIRGSSLYAGWQIRF